MTNIIEFKTEHKRETEQHYDLEEINNIKGYLHLLEKFQARGEKQVFRMMKKCYENPLCWYSAKTQKRLRHIAYKLDSRIPLKSLTDVHGDNREEYLAQKYIQEDICILPWLIPQRDVAFCRSRGLVMEEAWEICTREIHPKDMFDVFLAAERFVFYHRALIRNYEKALLKKIFRPLIDLYENLESTIPESCESKSQKDSLNLIKGGRDFSKKSLLANTNLFFQKKQ